LGVFSETITVTKWLLGVLQCPADTRRALDEKLTFEITKFNGDGVANVEIIYGNSGDFWLSAVESFGLGGASGLVVNQLISPTNSTTSAAEDFVVGGVVGLVLSNIVTTTTIVVKGFVIKYDDPSQ
jgi:hypothetical protein